MPRLPALSKTKFHFIYAVVVLIIFCSVIAIIRFSALRPWGDALCTCARARGSEECVCLNLNPPCNNIFIVAFDFRRGLYHKNLFYFIRFYYIIIS